MPDTVEEPTRADVNLDHVARLSRAPALGPPVSYSTLGDRGILWSRPGKGGEPARSKSLPEPT